KHHALPRGRGVTMAGGHEGLPGNWIYGPLHESLADCGLYSAAAHARNRRATLPGIRRDVERGHCGFPLRVTHHNTDDVLPIFKARRRAGARKLVSSERAGFQVERGLLCGRTALGASPPAVDAFRHPVDNLPERVFV